jgi:hypothetical protein
MNPCFSGIPGRKTESVALQNRGRGERRLAEQALAGTAHRNTPVRMRPARPARRTRPTRLAVTF